METLTAILDNQIKELTFKLNEKESVRITRSLELESFTLWNVYVTVESRFEQYAQLNDDEISMNFDDTHIRAMEKIKTLPEPIQEIISLCKEEMNDYNEENCLIYRWSGQTVPGGLLYKEFSKYF